MKSTNTNWRTNTKNWKNGKWNKNWKSEYWIWKTNQQRKNQKRDNNIQRKHSKRKVKGHGKSSKGRLWVKEKN